LQESLKRAKVFCFFFSKKKAFFFSKKKQKTFARLPDQPLVFLHIPKSSGISVSQALLQAQKTGRNYFGFDRAFFGSFADFASVPAENRAYIHLSPDTLPRGETFIRAHMALSTLRAAYPDGQFITVLREPTVRLLSHFVFWRGFSPAQDAAWGGWAARSGLARGTLEMFLAAPEIACQIDNVATRLLLWPHKLIPDDGPIDPAHDATLIEAATRRLLALDFVDVIENPVFHANLAAWLGTATSHPRINETETVPAALRTRLDEELTPRAADLLAARARLDLVLWHAVLRARAPGLDAETLRVAAVRRGTARAALLLSGSVLF
jgi:hypothetical protein